MIRNGIRVLAKGCGMDDQRPFNEAVATALHRRLLSEGEFVPYTVERMFDGLCACATTFSTAARNTFRLFTLKARLVASGETRHTIDTVATSVSMVSMRPL